MARGSMRNALFAVLTAACLVSTKSYAIPGGPQESDRCAVIEEARQVVEQIRQERFKSPVSCGIKTRAQIGEYIKTRIAQELSPQELAFEGLIFRALGMFPVHFEYPHAAQQIYETALGGYYDPASDSFFMADWISQSSARSIAIHELVHALQDQRFDLEHFVDLKALTGDETLARMALVEGEATVLTLDAEEREAQRLPAALRVSDLLMPREADFPPTFSAEFPEPLQQLVQFPYSAGVVLALRALEPDGYRGIEQLFQRPPRSTEEVLHPKKLRALEPDFVVPPPLDTDDLLYADRLGEFAIRLLMRALGHAPEAAVSIAAGWGGDRVEVLRLASDNSALGIRWRTYWDTLTDATEFVRGMSDGQARRGSTTTPVVGIWGSVAPGIRLRIRGAEPIGRFIGVVVDLRVSRRHYRQGNSNDLD